MGEMRRQCNLRIPMDAGRRVRRRAALLNPARQRRSQAGRRSRARLRARALDGVSGEIVSRHPGRDALDAGNPARSQRGRGRRPSGRFRYSTRRRRVRSPRRKSLRAAADKQCSGVVDQTQMRAAARPRARKPAQRPRDSRKATDWSSTATVRVPDRFAQRRPAADDAEAGPAPSRRPQ